MEKINIAEILKNYPSGTKLDCTMYEDVYFDYVDNLNIIHCYIKNEGFRTSITFNQYGAPNSNIKSKCVIFLKGKTTWDTSCKFKNGDIVATSEGAWIGITTGGEPRKWIPTYCVIQGNGKFEAYLDEKVEWVFCRLATEKEKQKLFKAINDNGYEWDPETKTLKELIKPKFKVGDRIKKKSSNEDTGLITDIADNYYIVETKYGMVITISINIQNNYELVLNKFDINTLKPFDKVLVRDGAGLWRPNLFGKDMIVGYRYFTANGSYKECIPYKGNEHLLGTNDDCNEFYKTWK